MHTHAHVNSQRDAFSSVMMKMSKSGAMRSARSTTNEEAHSSVNTIRNESIIALHHIVGTPEAPQYQKL
jgi:hypothetical protein